MSISSGCAQASLQNGLSSVLGSGHGDQLSLLKDEVLDNIASSANVAQFVSFGPDLTQRFSGNSARGPKFAKNVVSDQARSPRTAPRSRCWRCCREPRLSKDSIDHRDRIPTRWRVHFARMLAHNR